MGSENMTDWETIRSCARPNAESSAAADFHKIWNQVIDEGKAQEIKWISQLRQAGYKAAHPNDGWVDRKRNTITFCYPQFNDGYKVDDLVMLGWASEPHKNVPIKLTSHRQTIFGAEEWFFEPATQAQPQQKD